MNKRGFDLTFANLIKATLVIIVLVVLVLIFTGTINFFGKTNTCTSRGGSCTTECAYATIYVEGCTAPDVCCLQPS
jgi:hypothetical protein